MTISMEMFSFLQYAVTYGSGIVAAIIVNAFQAPLYRVSRRRAAVYTILMISLGLYGATLGAKVYNLFQTARGQNADFNIAIYGTIFTVIITMTVSVLIEKAVRKRIQQTRNPDLPQVSLRNTMDMLEPGAFILVFATKARCALGGCCHGIPCSWGVFSTHLRTTVFPVQLVEMAVTTSILIVVFFLKRRPFFRRGMAIFLAGGMFSFGRFFLEYLMYYVPEDRTYLGIFTFWQCASILVFATCVATLIYLYKTQPADPLPKRGEPLPDPPPPKEPTPKKKRQKKPKIPKKPLFEKQTVSQKKYAKGWQSTKKKYKK